MLPVGINFKSKRNPETYAVEQNPEVEWVGWDDKKWRPMVERKER
jgi:hypothetical protein